MKHLKHGLPEAMPDAAQKTREELSKLKKDDVDTYRPLVELYKVQMLSFASRNKKHLHDTLHMAVNDVCLRSHRAPLSAASRAMALAVGVRAVQEYPKMVLGALKIIKIGTGRSTHEFENDMIKINLERQIDRLIKIAKRAKKLADAREAKAEEKAASKQAPSSPTRARLTAQSGSRAQATLPQPAHK